MPKYVISIEGGIERNCLQFMGQGKGRKGHFEKETSKMNDLKMCCYGDKKYPSPIKASLHVSSAYKRTREKNSNDECRV